MNSRDVLMKTEATRMGQGIQEGAGRNPAGTEVRVEADAGAHSWTNAEPNTRMERVLERPNLMRAYQRVVSNKGAKPRANLSNAPDNDGQRRHRVGTYPRGTRLACRH